jgi:hypothetical protein
MRENKGSDPPPWNQEKTIFHYFSEQIKDSIYDEKSTKAFKTGQRMIDKFFTNHHSSFVISELRERSFVFA